MSERNRQSHSPAIHQQHIVQHKVQRRSRATIATSPLETVHSQLEINDDDNPKTSTPIDTQLGLPLRTNLEQSEWDRTSKDTSAKSGFVKKIISTTKTSTVKQSGTSNKNISRKSYSDYSSGYNDSDSEELPKTDYTYAKSISYRSRVTPNRGLVHPNMSRPTLRSSKSSHSVISDTSSDDEMKLYKGLDTEYSDNEDFEQIHKQNNYKAINSTSIFSKIISIITTITMIGPISRAIGWLWFNIWKMAYFIICYIMLLDTWILQKCSRIRKWKFLLFVIPLLILFLLLLSYLFFEKSNYTFHSLDHFITPVSTSFITFWSSIWSEIPSSKGSVEIIKSAFNNLHLDSITTAISSWILAVWAMLFKSKETTSITKEQNIINHNVHISSMLNSEITHMSEDKIKILMQEVFRQEIASWATQQKFGLTKEQEEEIKQHSNTLQKLQSELNYILNHAKNVEFQVTEMKNTIQIQENRKENTETSSKLHMLENRLEEVEQRIHTIEDILIAMRNCCRNQSEYVATAEKHVANLLLQIMNGHDEDKSQFASFGRWLKNKFVAKEELNTQMGIVADRLSSDLSDTLKQRAELVAKAAAAAIVAESVKSKEYSSETHNGLFKLINDTQSCASEEEVRKIVKDAIFLYDADKTGLVDYALESSGGSIFSTRCSETYNTGTAQLSVFGIPIWYKTNSPRTVIQPEVHPGQCWAFKGTQGYLVIKLSMPIHPTAFSIEHIPKTLSLTGSIDSAPKDFSVFGLTSESDLEGQLLGTYTYNKDGDPLQYFYVKELERGVFPIIELRILSNHGNVDYTCLYRFRVHGKRQ